MTTQIDSRALFARVVVHDLERQAEFYRAVFGYGEGQFIKADVAGEPVEEILFFGASGVDFALITFPGRQAPSPTAAMNAFTTTDLDAFESRMLAAGGTIHQPIGPLDAGDRMMRMAIYRDPEGILFELIEGAA